MKPIRAVLICVMLLMQIAAANAQAAPEADFPLAERTVISSSMMDEMPAHRFRLYLPEYEGRRVYVRELKSSFPIVSSYAEFERPDYACFDALSGDPSEAYVSASLSVFLMLDSGEAKSLGQIEYRVESRLSPVTLVSPSQTRAETAQPLYLLQFLVEKNSTVLINGQDQSALVNDQNGLVTYPAAISPTGDNVFFISVQAPYRRETTLTVTIFREPQEIPLEVDAPPAGRVADKRLLIRGTTSPDASVTVRSPHEDLKVSRLFAACSFSFTAVFDHYGVNHVVIEASREGAKSSVVELDINYVPGAAVYTLPAWDMNDRYADYLNHTMERVASSQIYLCRGTVTEIVNDMPQQAWMALAADPERRVLLQNDSGDPWEAGRDYRVYADAWGLYNGAPWLVGRYTYRAN